ncbi:hypothetical protein EJ07DRAFT_151839 [Lizonia empirigonia]|nr:hypothetical protein EJ07DRAFT_151839 [Lizonia empirigonia]
MSSLYDLSASTPSTPDGAQRTPDAETDVSEIGSASEFNARDSEVAEGLHDEILERDYAELENQYNALKTQYEELSQEYTGYQRVMGRVTNDVDNRFNSVLQQRDGLQADLDQVDADLSDLLHAYRCQTADLNEALARAEHLEVQIQGHLGQHADLEGEIYDIRAENSRLRSTHALVRADLRTERAFVARQEAVIRDLQEVLRRAEKEKLGSLVVSSMCVGFIMCLFLLNLVH